ncbi:MAG: hypothetical protein HZA46_09410 [Planctomycetales bacterium]|nr:hypothetical protein [Planctomycetales bacterium]
MNAPVDLLTLLRLLDGRLSPSAGLTLRERIVTDEEVRRHWQLLWHASQNDDGVSTGGEPSRAMNGHPGGISADQLAALVEGVLDPAEAAAVERECWRSPDLLREALSTFRFLHESGKRTEVPATLTARLLQIGADVHRPSTPPTDDAVATLDEIAVSHFTESPRRTGRRQRSLAIVAAIALLLAGVAVVVWLQNGRDEGGPGGGGENIVTNPNASSSNDGSEIPAPNDKSPAPLTPDEPVVVQTPTKPDETVVTIPKPTVPTPDPRPDDPRPVPPQLLSIAQIAWSDVRGLLVSSRLDEQRWQVVADTIRVDQPTRLATLPESWVQGRLGGAGQIVLAEDTEVVIVASNGSPPVVDLSLSRGRAAVRDVPVDARLRLQVGAAQFELTVAERNTWLGVEKHGNTLRLVVRAGQVKLNGKAVKAGRQIVWSDTGFGPSQPTKGNVAWMQRPEGIAKLPASLLASLKSSEDIASALADLRTDSKTALDSRLVATRWSLALNSGDTVWESLNAPQEQVRVQTLDAIVRMADGDPRLPQAVRAINAAINDDVTSGNVTRWFRAASRGQNMAAADAWSMVDALSHDELAVRQMAVFFLERGTGMRMPGFNPSDMPRARMQGIQQWTQVITQRFGARQAPRRRVP